MRFALKFLAGVALANLGIAAILTLSTAGALGFAAALAFTAPVVFGIGALCTLPYLFRANPPVTNNPTIIHTHTTAPTPLFSFWRPSTWFRPGPRAHVHHTGGQWNHSAHRTHVHPSTNHGRTHHHTGGGFNFGPRHRTTQHGHSRSHHTLGGRQQSHVRPSFFGQANTHHTGGGIQHGHTHGHHGGRGASVRMR